MLHLAFLIPCVIEGFGPMFFNEWAPKDFFALNSVFSAMYYGADYILVSEPVFLIIYLLIYQNFFSRQ